MKIAFVSTILAYPFGGADHLWLQTAEQAVKEGHKIFLALSSHTAAHARVRALEKHGAFIHLRDGHTLYKGRRSRWSANARRWLRLPSSLPGALDSFAPDVVLINQGSSHDFLVEEGLIEQIEQTRTPAVLVCQSNDDSFILPPSSKQRAADLMQKFASIVFVSTHNRRLAERQIDSLLPRAVIVHNPSLLGFPTPVPWPDTPTINFATVARLDNHDKGFDLLLPALAEILGSQLGWKLNLFGSGPDEQPIRLLAGKLGLTARLTFHGHVHDIQSVWRSNHILLLPSRREGCSLAMMEALRCGRPVLATPVGGVDDWIKPSVNGFIASSCNVPALSICLHNAWAVRERWREMGLAAYLSTQTMADAPAINLLNILKSASDIRP